jgi:hypothetical protein
MLLAGCAGDQPAAPDPAPAHTPAPKPAPAPPPAPDQCGATEAQKYVGKPRTEIPVPLIPDWQRVACTTCPVTMEFMPKRLNFFYDAETGIVKEVKCG